MDNQDWIERWQQGNIGFHQKDGAGSLRQCWSPMPNGARVLVPLCGKSVDMVWLADQGLQVVGVELSELAIETFFEDNELSVASKSPGALTVYRARELPITLHCGDYFEFQEPAFDGVFDRASLVALSPKLRVDYAKHTQSLLKPDAQHVLITLEYDQELVDGPPFSVLASEVQNYWPHLTAVKTAEALDTCPPRFREAGLETVTQVTWVDNTHHI